MSHRQLSRESEGSATEGGVGNMTNRVLGGWIGLAGTGLFFAGAAVATSVGVWDLGGAELLEGVRQSAASWRWGNVLLSLGAAISAMGVILAASETRALLGRAAATLWLIAGAAGLGGFILQGEGTLRAAGIGIGVFVLCGIAGSVAFGWHMRTTHSLSPRLFRSGVVVFIVALVFAFAGLPAAAELMAGWISAAQLGPSHPASSG